MNMHEWHFSRLLYVYILDASIMLNVFIDDTEMMTKFFMRGGPHLQILSSQVLLFPNVYAQY